MWGCPPQQTSPFSWPGEGGQVEDYARRGDEVDQRVDLASIGWKSPLDRRMRSRMAPRPIQFTGMEERHTPKSELLRIKRITYIEALCIIPLCIT